MMEQFEQQQSVAQKDLASYQTKTDKKRSADGKVDENR